MSTVSLPHSQGTRPFAGAKPLYWLAAIVVLVGIGVIPMQFGSQLAILLLIPSLIDAIFATGVSFLLRQSGKISFGHAAYFGMAAYLATLLLNQRYVIPEVAIVIALAVPTVLGFALGVVFARIPGVAHAMLTLAVGQGLYELAFRLRPLTNGDDGLAVSLPGSIFGLSATTLQSPPVVFMICWTVLVLILTSLFFFSRTPFSHLTEAIRDNPQRAEFIGYGIVLPSAMVYAISAFVAACAGLLFAIYNLFVTPVVLHWSTSGAALIMAIIGGPRYILGPAVGAFAYFFLKEFIGGVSDLWPALLGAILIIVTLLVPDGIAGALVQAWKFAARRGGRNARA